MASREMPGLGLNSDWDLGENGWKDGMDENLLKLSVLVQGNVLDIVAEEPVGPSEGDRYILDESHEYYPNNVIVYDEGIWHYFEPESGWLIFNNATDTFFEFGASGMVWSELQTGGGGPGLPVGGTTGQVLTKQSGADGDADWQAPPTGVWELMFKPTDNEPPLANFATYNLRNNHPVLQFDTTTQEIAIFSAVLPTAYSGNGLTVDLIWSAASATSGTIGWDVAIERIGTTQDIDSDSFATAQTVTAANVNGTSGIPSKTSVNIANGSDMDSLAAGELFRIRVRRDVANDTATGDAELLAVLIREQ